MSITLNHTIVYARNRDASAAFLAEILGLPEPKPFGPFLAMAGWVWFVAGDQLAHAYMSFTGLR